MMVSWMEVKRHSVSTPLEERWSLRRLNVHVRFERCVYFLPVSVIDERGRK